jgi:hypothetical protein
MSDNLDSPRATSEGYSRSRMECCGTCRFWKPNDRFDAPGEEAGMRFDVDKDEIGHGCCRRQPPVFIPQLVELVIDRPRIGGTGGYDREDVFSETGANNATMFPGTYKSEWCGEFDWREHLRPMDAC